MKQQPGPRPRSASGPEFQRGPAVVYRPDGTPMHWSEAAKYRRGLYPGSAPGVVSTPTAEPVAAPIPATPQPAPRSPVEPKPTPQAWMEPAPVVEPAVAIQASSRDRRAVDRVSWSASVLIMVIIAILALGGAVIPFCATHWESLEWSTWFGGSTTDVRTSTTVATADEAASTEEPPPAETATTEVSDRQTSAAYLDAGSSLTFVAPTGWDPMSPELLADYQPYATYLATVAETAGPTLAGVFLNGMAIKALDVPQGEALAPGLAQQAAQRFVDEGLDTYAYFKVLTPTREAMVGPFDAQTATARITWNERVLVKSIYTFIAGDGLYQVEFYVDDVDYGDHRETFEGILDSFALAGGSVTPR